MAALLSVEILARHFSPFEHEVWGEAVSQADVLAALAQGRLVDQPGGTDHAGRIAYLVENPTNEPLVIDVGVPSLGCVVAWPIQDGNHRLAAAIVRGDATIEAEVGGEVAYAESLFGDGCTL